MRVPLRAMLAGLGVLATASPVVDAATTNNDNFSVPTNGVLTGVNILQNDGFVSNGFSLFAGPASHGNVLVDVGGNLTYIPVNGYSGPDSFSYTIRDVNGASNALVSLIIAPPPHAVDDNYQLGKDSHLGPVNIVGNDSHNGNTLTVVAGAAAHGNAAVDALGNLNYQPNAGYVGPDSFSYVISDEFGNSSAQVNLVVVAPVTVPTLETSALTGLAGLLAFFGMRRRRRK